MTKESQNKLHIEIVSQMLTLATAGFGLVAALAWNSLIQAFVDDYIKNGSQQVVKLRLL